MRKHLFLTAALGAIALSGLMTSAQAAPFSGGGNIAIGEKGAGIEQIYWKRVCDRDGDDCHRVWIRDRDNDRPVLRFRFRDRDDERRRHRHHDHDRDDRR